MNTEPMNNPKHEAPGYGVEIRDDIIEITVGTETVGADAATWLQLAKDGWEMQKLRNPNIRQLAGLESAT